MSNPMEGPNPDASSLNLGKGGENPPGGDGKAVRQPGIIFKALGSKISSEELLGRLNQEVKES